MHRIIEDIIIGLKRFHVLLTGNLYNKEAFLSKYIKYKDANGKKVLGEGGNAMVFNVKSIATDEAFALKFLKTTKKEKRIRFLEEIDIIVNNYKTIEGVLPIFDYDRTNFWYTMPKATPVIEYIKEKKADIHHIIEEYLLLVDTFIELHNKGISHRDIKPDNIYFYEGRFFIGDFGLVNYPDKDHKYTKSDQGIGAIFTIAPEMKRDPKKVKCPEKADIYSLAKTLWMLITGDEKGFDGQYNYTNPLYALRLKDKFRKTHLAELELLLTDSTKDNPVCRPSILNFKERLLLWIDACTDEDKSGISDWHFLNKLIFKGDEPQNCTWVTPERIVEILNHICWLPTENHVLFASRGGLDMTEATLAKENGCICISFEKIFHSIIKPKAFHYDTFKGVHSWNYFILEADTLKSVSSIPDDADSETLVEDIPGNYVDAQYYHYGVYDYDKGNPLPETARLVERHVKGVFLIVLKCGIYNAIPETYDGRHSECNPSDFRNYVNGIIEALNNTESTKADLTRAINVITKHIIAPNDFLKDTKSKAAPSDFTTQNFVFWNFIDCLPTSQYISTILIFKVQVLLTDFVDSFFYDSYWVLSNGSIGVETDEVKIFEFTDRDVLIQSLSVIENKVNGYVKAAGYDYISAFDKFRFSTSMTLTGKPTHLFTYKEIEYLMRNADDRTNNQLVIDELGYAHILTERNMAQYYPVSRETWCAGNNYVGRYSSLSDLDSAYTDSLVCWLRFLKTNCRQYCDCNEYADIDETIAEIKKYY